MKVKLPTFTITKKATIIAAVSGIVLVTLGTTSAYAAQSNALPGSLLYPFKKAWEDVSLVVAPNPTAKAQTHLNIAQNRINSIQQATTTPALPAIQQAQQNLQSALNDAKQISDANTKKDIKKSVAEEASRVEKEIETEKKDSTDSEHSTSDASETNAKISADASTDD